MYTVLNTKLLRPESISTKRRSFKNFNNDAFLNDLNRVPFPAAYLFERPSPVTSVESGSTVRAVRESTYRAAVREDHVREWTCDGCNQNGECDGKTKLAKLYGLF